MNVYEAIRRIAPGLIASMGDGYVRWLADELEVEGVTLAPTTPRARAMTRRALTLAAAILLAFAAGRVTAAPRSAPEDRMGDAAGRTLAGAADVSAQGHSGAPQYPSASPSAPVATPLAGTWPSDAPTATPDASESPGRPSLSGVASWYFDGAGLYAAVPGWDGVRRPATVCTPAACVTVQVRDACQCYVGTRDERIIDLSPAAFRALAPLSAGLVAVVVEP